MPKALPSLETRPGVAPACEFGDTARTNVLRPEVLCEPGTSRIEIAVHARFASVPDEPPPVAAMWRNVTFPKFASDATRQSNRRQLVGASVTQPPAEELSDAPQLILREKLQCRVLFSTRRATRSQADHVHGRPDRVAPGITLPLMFRAMSGTISYHAK